MKFIWSSHEVQIKFEWSLTVRISRSVREKFIWISREIDMKLIWISFEINMNCIRTKVIVISFAIHMKWASRSIVENDCPTVKNRGLGPLGPSILDPIYVIYAFGSMLSCILCERQKFSESHKLKRFGARNQFRAARFVTVWSIGCSLNAMELVVRN